ncbi:MAG: T9SS type A sorting domain-containing protein [Saprospiraceae bacterium]
MDFTKLPSSITFVFLLIATINNTNAQLPEFLQYEASGADICMGYDLNGVYDYAGIANGAPAYTKYFVIPNENYTMIWHNGYNSYVIYVYDQTKPPGQQITIFFHHPTRDKSQVPLSGWIPTTNCTGLTGPTWAAIIPAPVEMIDFTSKIDDKVVLLKWSTASEVNNQGWEVQRSTMGHKDWQIIGWTEGSNNSNSILSYTFADTDPQAGKNYYRLRQIDFDGKTEYSKTTMATLVSNSAEIIVYPNPASDHINIGDLTELTSYRIYNAIGKMITCGSTESGHIDIASLDKGYYLIDINVGAGNHTKRFVKL